MDINTLNMNIDIVKLILKSMKDSNKLWRLFESEIKAFYETYNIFDSFLLEQIENIKFINNCVEEKNIMVEHYKKGYIGTVDALVIFEGCLCFSRDFTHSKLYIKEDKLIEKLSLLEKELIQEQLIKFSKEETSGKGRKRL